MISVEVWFDFFKKHLCVFKWKNLCNSYLFLFAVLCSFLSIYARSNQPVYGSFRGIVTDEREGKSVKGANITIIQPDFKTVTDSIGIFSFDSVPVGVYIIMIAALEFDTMIVNNVHIKAKRNVMGEFSLIKSGTVTSLDKMVVKARSKQYNSTQSNSVTHFSIYEMNNTPATFNDINRILATSPSAVMQGDPSYQNGVMVRGGNPAENVYMLDGFEIENPNHLGNYQSSTGAISFINSNLVRNIDFYTGAYPAELSPGLSSVAAITFRNGSMTDRKHAVDLGITGLGLTTEGPLPKSLGSYIMSGRMVNTRFLRFFVPSLPVMPLWDDAFIKGTLHLNPDNELTILLAGAKDQLRMIQWAKGIENDGGASYAQSIGGVKWQLSKPDFTNRLYLSGRYLQTREYWDLTEMSQRRLNFSHLWDRDWRRYTAQLKDHFTLYFGDDQLDAGFIC